MPDLSLNWGHRLVITMMCVIDRKSLQAEIESLQQKFQKACQDINEEKSLRIRAELRIQGLETELQAHTDDVAVLQSQIDDYRDLGDERTRQVSFGSYNGLYTYSGDYLYTTSYMIELVNVCVSLCRWWNYYYYYYYYYYLSLVRWQNRNDYTCVCLGYRISECTGLCFCYVTELKLFYVHVLLGDRVYVCVFHVRWQN